MTKQSKKRNKKQRQLKQRIIVKRSGVLAWINVILCVLANGLIFSVAYEGTTLAWLTGRTDYNAGINFSTAEIGFTFDKGDFTSELLKLTDTDILNGLINEIGGKDNQREKDEYFAEWYNGSAGMLEPHEAPAAQNSVISYRYTLKNESGIPVYLRVTRPKAIDMDVAMAALWEGETENGMLEYDEDGFYYLLKSVGVHEEITVNFVVFILGSGEKPSLELPEYAEVIQATNNAVYLSGDWPKFEYEGNFISHDDTDDTID